jgi:hypothetical protein
VSKSEVSDLIAAVRRGSMSLEEVAERFRLISWKRTRHALPESYLEQAAVAQSDPEPDVPGSIDEVTAAYDRGDLTQEQYRVLSRAVADSINAEYETREDGSETGSSE